MKTYYADYLLVDGSPILVLVQEGTDYLIAQVLRGSIKFGDKLTEQQLEEHQFELDYI